MPNYKLLTPGPLTTTDTVKKEMLFENDAYDGCHRKQLMIESYTEVKFFDFSIKRAFCNHFYDKATYCLIR